MPDLPVQTRWKFLERDPYASFTQLSIKGRRIRARTLYGLYMNAEEPMTVEEIARDYGLPVEVVEEAIAYCKSNPPEIEQDWLRTQAIMEASGENDPGYRLNSKPKYISPEVMTEIERKFG